MIPMLGAKCHAMRLEQYVADTGRIILHLWIGNATDCGSALDSSEKILLKENRNQRDDGIEADWTRAR